AWSGKFFSSRAPDVRVGTTSPEPESKPAIYRNAHDTFFPSTGVQRTQFLEFQPEVVSPEPATAVLGATRRVQLSPRSSVPNQITYDRNPRNPNEWITTINSGVKLRIDGMGVSLPGGTAVGTVVDLEADRVVIWTQGNGDNPLDFSQPTEQSAAIPMEIYLEGDIIVREGDRIILAQSMYYNAQQRTGIILNSEVLTPVPTYAGLLRLRSDVLRQVAPDRFVADGASFTTSRMAMPTWEFRSGTLELHDQQVPMIDPFTRQPVIDPVTGQPRMRHRQMVTSRNNVGYVSGVPVFYWPVLATSLENPTFYINDLQYRSDTIFGNVFEVGLDMYQILGISDPPPDSEWSLSLDYLSKRGPAAGTRFAYENDIFFGTGMATTGMIDAWFIHDTGLDTLGSNQAAMVPATENRGRLVARHKQQLQNNWSLTAQLGYVSDINFLDQYFEPEWNESPDTLTSIWLTHIQDNQSWVISASAQINQIFLDTTQVPRVDHFSIGRAFWEDRLVWNEHSSAGYFMQWPSALPVSPQQLADFGYLPYEVETSGVRAVTRQGVELPLEAGPFKVVPYLLGEAAYWGDDLTQNDISRLYGQAGVRGSIPFWNADSTVESSLLNLHGLAHKVTFEGDFSYTDASQDITNFPLYDEIDDNNTQTFRRRLAQQDFGLVPPVPTQFDERFYGVRRGLQDNVTGPTEIVDDLTVGRLGINQRWQTKRGPIENRRIIDWITLDLGTEIFPDSDQNFGENVGFTDYDFRWHVGDRVTLLSSGGVDFFSDGGQQFTVGASLNRPPRGNVFLGFRSLEGPINSSVLLAAYSYRMSPKWASSYGINFNMQDLEYMGQSLTLTRIGESFLFTFGFNADQSRDNVGLVLALEPRFLPKTQFGRRTGIVVPPSGAYGFE
ncbi:MAG: hypothetical protein SGJ20_17705, partial [Planctomycetota bacterium]|nr:hypothetical protein [Planctomycetota bacterium]